MSDPAVSIIAVTPSDAADITVPFGHFIQGLYVSAAGDVRLTTPAGDEVTVAGVAGGTIPVEVTKVWATGTTATVFALIQSYTR